MQVQNFQLKAWNRFFEKEIYEFVSSFNYTRQGVTVRFKPSNAERFTKIQHPRGLRDIWDILKVDVEVSVNNDVSFASSHVYPDVPLAALPIMTQDGIVLGGTKYGATSNLVPAGGWYQIYETKTSKPYPVIELRSITTPKLTFAYRNGRLTYQGLGDSSKPVPILTYLKAMSPSLSYEDIVARFDDDPIIWGEFLLEASKELPIDECAKKVFEADGSNYKVYENAATILQNRVYNENSLRIGAERVPRFKNFMSFTKAMGLTLARDVDLGDMTLQAGTILSAAVIRKIEESQVRDLYVLHNNTEKHLYKIDVQENITFDEIICAIHHFCLFCDGLGVVDKQDNYCNKILEPIGRDIEMFLASKFRVLKNSINEKFGKDEVTSIELSSDILNRKVTIDDFRKHMKGNDSYKLLDQINSMATFEQAFRVSGGSSSNIPASARDVQKSQYGCVCPYATSESDKVGLNLSLSTLAGIDDYGFISTPALAVSNGKVAEEPVYMSTIDVRGHIFAPFDVDIPSLYAQDPDTIVKGCRLNGELIDSKLSEIDYQDVSPLQVFGPLVANVPSAERDAGKRLLMAGSAQKQAIPTWSRERPWVTTAIEAIANIGITRAREIIESALMERDLPLDIPEDTKLILVEIRQSGNINTLEFECTHPELTGKFEYTIHNMSATIKGTPKHSRVNMDCKNEQGILEYSLNDIVIYANDIECQHRDISTDTINFGQLKRPSSIIADHALALGNNVKVLFKSYDGWGYEDSIVVRQGFASSYGLAILTTYDVKEELEDNEKFAYNINNGDIASYMQANGLPRVGTFLKSGQDIIGKAILDKDGKVLKWATQKLDIKIQGYVVSARISEDGKVAYVTVGDVSVLSEGDKLAGVHGNKGVVGRIVPDHEMPYTEDGEIPDIILNPLGVISRNNLGQMAEFTEAAIGMAKNEIQVLPPFSGKKIGQITGEAQGLGLVEKDIYDGRTGRKFPKKAMIGVMHFLRLEHTSTSKYKACSTGDSAINPRTLQINGKPGGAQKVSELGSWCLNSYGADGLLDTLFTIQCDDVVNKAGLTSSIRDNYPSSHVDYQSNNIDFLNAYFRLLGINIAWRPDGLTLDNLTSADIKDLSNGDCDLSYGDATMPQSPYYMIRDPRIFGDWGPSETEKIKSRKYYGRLPLLSEVIMPIFLKSNAIANLIWYYNGDDYSPTAQSIKGFKRMSAQAFSSILDGEKYVANWVGYSFVNPEHYKILCEELGVKELELKFPVLKSTKKSQHELRYDADLSAHTRISGLVEIFKSYDPRCSILLYEANMAAGSDMDFIRYLWGKQDDLTYEQVNKYSDLAMEDKGGLIERRNQTLDFVNHKNLSDFVVDGVAVPPIGYRPMFGDKPATAMDQQLHSVISAVRQLRSVQKDTPLWHTQVHNIWRALAAMTNDEKSTSSNKSVISELCDHSSHASVMRDTLLAKRVSHSGRSVISINPKLKFGHCGVPISIASKIFEDHIVSELRHNPSEYPAICSLNINTSAMDSRVPHRYKKMIVFLANDNLNGFAEFVPAGRSVHKTFYVCKHELIMILKKLFKQYPALLNRDPSLHKFSYGGFDAEPVNIYSIQLPPLACHGFNADFDGDQMAVFFPQHERGIRDVREKMMQQDNIINPKDCEMIVALNQDIILGLYYCSMYPGNSKTLDMSSIKAYYTLHGYYSFDDWKPNCLAELYDDIMIGRISFQDTVLVRNGDDIIINTAGRILLNAMIPAHFGFTSMYRLEVTPEQQRNMSKQERMLFDELLALRKKELYDKDVGLDDYKFRKDHRYKEIYDKYTVKWNGLPVCNLTFDFLVKKSSIKEITKFVATYFETYAYKADHDGDTFAACLDRIKSLGFYCADYSGTTLSLYDFERLPISSVVHEGMKDVTAKTDAVQQMYSDGLITDDERSKLTIQAWTSYRQQLTQDIDTCFRGGKPSKYTFNFDNTDNIFMVVDSGARGDTYQLVEIAGIIGNVTNASGETLETPIRSSYMEGMTVSEAFSNSYASRRDVMAAQLSTKDAGTLTRELIYDVEHLHSRDSDDFCGASSSVINLEYDALLHESVGVKLVLSNTENLTQSLWDNPEIAADYEARFGMTWDAAQQYTDYLDFVTGIRQIFPYDYVSPELNHFLAIKKIPYIVVDEGGSYRLSPVTYKLKNRSRYMLLYRTIDLDIFDDDIKTRLFNLREEVIPSERFDVDGERESYVLGPAEDYVVIGESMIDEIEKLRLDQVCIWTITGCHSTHGICKKCYGIKYDTKQFPSDMEYIGYQGVQSIGEPLAQIVLDAHKRADSGQDGGSKAKLHQLMSNPHDRPGTPAIIASSSGVVSIRTLSEGKGYAISVNEKETGQFTDVELLKVLPGQHVNVGDILVDGVIDYNKLRDLAGYQATQIAFWTDFLKIFSNQKIMARNFELLARAQTEFGIARESADGIHVGSIYHQNVLIEAGVDYTPTIVKSDKAMDLSGKVMAGIAHSNMAARSAYHILRGTKAIRDSNIGRTLVGDLKTNPSEEAKGVIVPIVKVKLTTPQRARPKRATSFTVLDLNSGELFTKTVEPSKPSSVAASTAGTTDLFSEFEAVKPEPTVVASVVEKTFKFTHSKMEPESQDSIEQDIFDAFSSDQESSYSE